MGSSKEFGKRLDTLIASKGLSNAEVGAAIHVSGQSVGKWRRGGKIDEDNLKALSSYLGVHWVWLRYGDEAIEEIRGNSGDIISESRRRWIEEALVSARRFSTACDMLEMGVWEADIANDRLWWSDGVFRLFGIGPQEFSGVINDFYSRVPPDEVEYLQRTFLNHMEGREPRYFVDHHIILPTGETRQVREVGMRQGGATMMLGVIWGVASETNSFMMKPWLDPRDKG